MTYNIYKLNPSAFLGQQGVGILISGKRNIWPRGDVDAGIYRYGIFV